MILGRVFGMLPALLVMLVVFCQGQAAKDRVLLPFQF